MADAIIETAEPINEIPDVNVMEMSDEDFANLSEPTEVVSDEPDKLDNADDATGNDTPDPAELPVTPEEDLPELAPDTKDVPDKPDDKNAPGTGSTEKDPLPAPGIDYKAEYEKLTAPFKANGSEVKVKDSDEILALMQMGANYHKKMATLKPSLKIMKLLERNDLLDESKLSYLIDLNSKNPAAITKLLKDSGMDPLAIDTSAENEYTPKVPVISDTELALDEVLESIKDSPSYNKTLTVVAETWDAPSRNAIGTNPHIISVINEQIASGIFDKVSGEVERARRFGKLQGMSDFEAYKAMGDLMHSQGQLDPVTPVTVNADPAVEAQRKLADEKLKAQKKAAAITTGKPAKKALPKSNLLDLSDEEFEKLPASAYTQLK